MPENTSAPPQSISVHVEFQSLDSKNDSDLGVQYKSGTGLEHNYFQGFCADFFYKLTKFHEFSQNWKSSSLFQILKEF